jgi:hypothetical protein
VGQAFSETDFGEKGFGWASISSAFLPWMGRAHDDSGAP